MSYTLPKIDEEPSHASLLALHNFILLRKKKVGYDSEKRK